MSVLAKIPNRSPALVNRFVLKRRNKDSQAKIIQNSIKEGYYLKISIAMGPAPGWSG